MTKPARGLLRKVSPKTLVFLVIGLTIFVCIYYAGYTSKVNTQLNQYTNNNTAVNELVMNLLPLKIEPVLDGSPPQRCQVLKNSKTDFDTVDVFKDLEFQPNWLDSREYWNKSFEDRYERYQKSGTRLPLKVFIVPHSHNDPGWLKTFEMYYQTATRSILNNLVKKLEVNKNFTFMWTEVAFLHEWWEEAHPTMQKKMKDLIDSGRLEITTGGWVMTDEANAHLYGMLNQLIEGHQWLLTNLNVKPKNGWSIDPFGHGSTFPQILARSGFTGTIIQRIHYAWKQWFAAHQAGDFHWQPNWSSTTPSQLITHNQPFDIYSIKHSCGPHPSVCLNFDFRKVFNEYTEYSMRAVSITTENVREKSELLLEQYARTASLFTHNVALIPLGDDFRYNHQDEWDQQYGNYSRIIAYINAHPERYNGTNLRFGTLRDYFDEINARQKQIEKHKGGGDTGLATLRGDFFVYSDIFTEGRPAYWSGYFTTRPFMKLLNRELEAALRTTEILYTIALNYARSYASSSRGGGDGKGAQKTRHKMLEGDFERLVRARRNSALFQHHDAITGTSKEAVMKDYGQKLFESLRAVQKVQQNALDTLLIETIDFNAFNAIIVNEERDFFHQLPLKTKILIGPNQRRKVLVFNTLAQDLDYLIQIRVNTTNVCVEDHKKTPLNYQINPVWDTLNLQKFNLTLDEYEVVFVARLKAFTLNVYNIVYTDSNASARKFATIYCTATNGANNCKQKRKMFKINQIPTGNIQLENHKFRLIFNGQTGLLKSVTRDKRPLQCGIKFGAYHSAQYHSGAYLFMTDPNRNRNAEKDVLNKYRNKMSVIITSGEVTSELSVIYGAFLVHTVTVYHDRDTMLTDVIALENIVDFEAPPRNRDTEFFMRLVTEVRNGDPPVFYTDSAGYQTQKRVKIERIGIEGNYYPITTMAFVQDERTRISLLTNHAQGAASWQPGQLEVMLDRRMLYDDARGMGEGVVDNYKTVQKYFLLIEDMEKHFALPESNDNGEVLRHYNVPNKRDAQTKLSNNDVYVTPSLYAHHLSNILNYPAVSYLVKGEFEDKLRVESARLINIEFPCDLHLVTLRTQSDRLYTQFPSSSAFVVLQRQGVQCDVSGQYGCDSYKFGRNVTFSDYVSVKSIKAMSLSGLNDLNESITSLSDISVEPMELKTFNFTFI